MADVEVYVNAEIEPVPKAQVGLFDFEGIFLAHFSRIVRVINRIVNDSGRSEDLAIEVFLEAVA
jgi:DNA-directed RNA polymerase specialized sigma24 family protein